MKANQPRTIYVVSCVPGQAVSLTLDPAVDPAAPVGRFFDAGDIDIMVARGHGEEVRLVISASHDFILHRDKQRY